MAEVVTNMNWEQLTDLAIQDTESGWGKIDKQLPLVCTDRAITSAAANGLINSNQHVQDLSASVFQSQETAFFKEHFQGDKQLISRLKRNVEEGAGPYAQFRAAFALYKHDIRSPMVDAKVKEALNDPAVAEIAKALIASKLLN